MYSGGKKHLRTALIYEYTYSSQLLPVSCHLAPPHFQGRQEWTIQPPEGAFVMKGLLASSHKQTKTKVEATVSSSKSPDITHLTFNSPIWHYFSAVTNTGPHAAQVALFRPAQKWTFQQDDYVPCCNASRGHFSYLVWVTNNKVISTCFCFSVATKPFETRTHTQIISANIQ